MAIRELILVWLICQLYKVNCASLGGETDQSQTDYGDYNLENSSFSTIDTITTDAIETSTLGTLRVAKQLQPHSGIYFSDADTNSDRLSHIKNQKPIVNYEKCSENEWFYPGDNEADWV